MPSNENEPPIIGTWYTVAVRREGESVFRDEDFTSEAARRDWIAYRAPGGCSFGALSETPRYGPYPNTDE